MTSGISNSSPEFPPSVPRLADSRATDSQSVVALSLAQNPHDMFELDGKSSQCLRQQGELRCLAHHMQSSIDSVSLAVFSLAQWAGVFTSTILATQICCWPVAIKLIKTPFLCERGWVGESRE